MLSTNIVIRVESLVAELAVYRKPNPLDIFPGLI